MAVLVSTAIERFFYLTWLRMFQTKNTIERKYETINVTNKHRHQNKRMVNEIKVDGTSFPDAGSLVTTVTSRARFVREI